MMKVSIVAANLQVTAFASERLWVSWLRGLIRTSITASPPVLQFFMGFIRRKMQDQRREAVEKEASSRRATDAQVLEDSERLIAAWNERQEKRMPMLFLPTIGAAITVGYWLLWVRCPACCTINAIDLRTLDRIMPAECTVRRARAIVAHQHRRRNARGASAARAGRVTRGAGSLAAWN
jgi:hypothetical protein